LRNATHTSPAYEACVNDKVPAHRRAQYNRELGPVAQVLARSGATHRPSILAQACKTAHDQAKTIDESFRLHFLKRSFSSKQYALDATALRRGISLRLHTSLLHLVESGESTRLPTAPRSVGEYVFRSTFSRPISARDSSIRAHPGSLWLFARAPDPGVSFIIKRFLYEGNGDSVR